MNTQGNGAADDHKTQGEDCIETKALSVWDDPTVPVGDAPPRSKWLLVAMATGWSAWVVFLVAMMLSVRESTGR